MMATNRSRGRNMPMRPGDCAPTGAAVGAAAALHLAAALGPRAAAGLATSALLLRDVAPSPRVVRGRAVVPPRPGLGIRLVRSGAAGPAGAEAAGGARSERPA